ncbi:unnamed protein product [Peronospora belbahrii]|uniref:Uncharacterized protein n=1 Tax=Peronospora belbahrii TaxID=622444 RepID=A0ABN8D4Y9_9STRA|nr:unnamed protein product [Peronospora belbahrii]
MTDAKASVLALLQKMSARIHGSSQIAQSWARWMATPSLRWRYTQKWHRAPEGAAESYCTVAFRATMAVTATKDLHDD